MAVNIFNPTEYKRVFPKRHKVYLTLGKTGLRVINKYSNPTLFRQVQKELITPRDSVYEKLTPLLQTGEVKEINSQTPFLMCGTQGEFDALSWTELLRNYTYNSQGTQASFPPIQAENVAAVLKATPGSVYNRMSTAWIEASGGLDTTPLWACFVPKVEQQKININGLYTEIVNNPMMDKGHGKGDFIICVDGMGGPNFSTMRIERGVQFREKFNNKGWDDKITTALASYHVQHIDTLPDYHYGSIKGTMVLDEIEKLFAAIQHNAHPQSGWKYQRTSPTNLQTTCNLIANMRNEWRKGEILPDGFISKLIITKDNRLILTGNAIFGTQLGDEKYRLDLGETNKALERFVQLKDIILGLTGFIRGDANQVSNVQPAQVGKEAFDGIMAYTVNSGSINRILRGQEAWYIKSLDSEGKAQWDSTTNNDKSSHGYAEIKRAIDGCDLFFDYARIGCPEGYITVFRGCPFNGNTFNISMRGGFEPNDTGNLAGWVDTNTAYSSTSLNLLSTFLFANPVNKGTSIGIIYALKIPNGTAGYYVHDIAGWEEQFEVLLHRKYDIKIGRKLCELQGGSCKFEVREAELVQHTPGGMLSQANHGDLLKQGITHYNNDGIVDVIQASANTLLTKSYELLRKKGYTNVKYVKTKERDYVCLQGGKHIKDPVTGMFVDISFSIKGHTLQTWKLYSYTDYELSSFWQDANRRNGQIDYNYARGFIQTGSVAAELVNEVDLTTAVEDGKTLAGRAAAIMQKILIFQTDCLVAPLQEIARYFDIVFKYTCNKFGYLLHSSTPVDRIVSTSSDDSDNGAGICKIKYELSGNKNNSVVVNLQLTRGQKAQDGRLPVNFHIRAAANGEKLNTDVSDANMMKKIQGCKYNSDGFELDTCNRDVMEVIAQELLVKLAKHLKLNHTQRLDSVMQFLSTKLSGLVVHALTDFDKIDDQKNTGKADTYSAQQVNKAGSLAKYRTYRLALHPSTCAQLGLNRQSPLMIAVTSQASEDTDGNYKYSLLMQAALPEQFNRGQGDLSYYLLQRGTGQPQKWITLSASEHVVKNYAIVKQGLIDYINEFGPTLK